MTPGFFHKRHVRKSARAIAVKCKYTCHKCQDVNRVKVAAKKVKAQSQKSTKVSTVCRILRSNSSKKTGKNKKPVQQQKNKKDTVVLPLRRSARRIQIVSLPNKKVGGRKKKRGKQIKPKKGISKKPKKCTWQKKRTGVYHSYWLNGLLLSKKPNDDRVENFRSKVLLARSDQLTDMVDQPKCSLCCEQEFSSRLTYVGCEICGGNYFHFLMFYVFIIRLFVWLVDLYDTWALVDGETCVFKGEYAIPCVLSLMRRGNGLEALRSKLVEF